MFFRATARLQDGDAKGAAVDFNSFLAKHVDDTEALMGRALARQFSGEYAGAEADLSAILTKAPAAAQPLAGRGYVRVMLGRYAAAADDLALAATLPNAPPEVALWRYIAETRAGRKAAPALAEVAKKAASDQWPSAVMHYFQGDLAGDKVLAAAAMELPQASGRLCEAYFYLGQAALIQKDTAEAIKLFEAAVATNMRRYTEYAGAQAELAHLASGGDPKPK